MNRHNLSLRKATHRILKDNMVVIKAKIDKDLDNVEVFRRKLNYQDELIINFDKTEIFFYYETTTVESRV